MTKQGEKITQTCNEKHNIPRTGPSHVYTYTRIFSSLSPFCGDNERKSGKNHSTMKWTSSKSDKLKQWWNKVGMQRKCSGRWQHKQLVLYLIKKIYEKWGVRTPGPHATQSRRTINNPLIMHRRRFKIKSLSSLIVKGR